MFDRDLVQSGFDLELLASEEYLSYVLLSLVEAGYFELRQKQEGQPDLDIHPPRSPQYRTSYRDVEWWETPEGADSPEGADETFKLELLPDDPGEVRSLGFTGIGGTQAVLVHTADGRVRAWDYADLSEITDAGFEVSGSFCSAFNREVNQLAVATADHSIALWDVTSKTLIRSFAGHTLAPIALAFSGAGDRVASSSLDKTVRVWNTATGAPVAVFEGHQVLVNTVKLSVDGTRAVSGDKNGLVYLWDVATGAVLQTFNHEHLVASVAFSHGGHEIVSGGSDGSIKVWNDETGELVRVLEGHTNIVVALEISPFGDKLASASLDRSVREWNFASGEHQVLEVGHIAPLRTLRYAAGSSKLGSGDANGATWVRDRDDETYEVRPFFGLAQFKVTRQPTVFEVPVKAYAYVDLTCDVGSNGLEYNHQFRIGFARFEEDTRVVLASFMDVAEQEAILRTRLDRTIDLGIAAGKRVQHVRIRKFVDTQSGKGTLGLYVNLALRAGPEPDNFVQRVPVVGNAVNFRGDEAVAFATSPGLFALLGPDFKYKMAEEDPPGSGDYRYPLRAQSFLPSDEVVGHINSISVGPDPSAVLGDTLRVRVNGELHGVVVDPDVAANLTARLAMQADGTVELAYDVDADPGLLAHIGGALTGLLTGVIFGGIPGAYLAIQTVGVPYIGEEIEDDLDDEEIAGVFDVLPFHLPVARRSWDPFFDTNHTITALLQERPIIDERGLAFSAPAVWLSRKQKVRSDRVIRDERRTGDEPTGMLFRVEDYEDDSALYHQVAPGAEHFDFATPDDVGEENMVGLTLEQFAERREKRRIYYPHWLVPKRIHAVFNQIDQLLCVTRQEITELQDSLDDDAGPGSLDEAIARILRFDLPPEEMRKLQNAGVIMIEGAQVVRRQRDDGTYTYYFRDIPDEDTTDNLLSLPHYTPPYVPPA